MFGIGGSEILVILIVALLFLGPDKLPDAAKQISKGIRDLKKQSRALQQTIENDEHIGGAIRDLKSALRGEEIPVRPPVRKPAPKKELAEPASEEPVAAPAIGPFSEAVAASLAAAETAPTPDKDAVPAKPAVTLPATAGERDPEFKDEVEPEELAAMIKPAAGTVAQGTSETDPKHGHG